MRRRLVLLALGPWLLSCSPAPTPAPPINGTSVVVVADHCKLSKSASREAEATMGRLIDTCNVVVTHPLAFGVVLQPGGAIGFASVGDAGGEEIPVCVAAQKLQHHVHLGSPCKLDVRFEPASIAAH
jgi:hypothetical protein